MQYTHSPKPALQKHSTLLVLLLFIPDKPDVSNHNQIPGFNELGDSISRVILVGMHTQLCLMYNSQARCHSCCQINSRLVRLQKNNSKRFACNYTVWTARHTFAINSIKQCQILTGLCIKNTTNNRKQPKLS